MAKEQLEKEAVRYLCAPVGRSGAVATFGVGVRGMRMKSGLTTPVLLANLAKENARATFHTLNQTGGAEDGCATQAPAGAPAPEWGVDLSTRA